MSTAAKAIACDYPCRANLLVARNDSKHELTLHFVRKLDGKKNEVIATAVLNTTGWHELLQSASFPPALPTGDEVGSAKRKGGVRV